MSRYARLIYDKTGIRVSPQKRMLLSNRLRRRLRQTGIEDFDAYYRYLTGLQDRHPEWDEFFQEITTHETYFFRDENQWDWFTNVYLEEHLKAGAKRSRRLRIWSAACSTGDEAYTIACCAAATLPSELLSKVDILGSDIAAGEIQRAEKPAYGQRSMRLVPEDYLQFFHKDDEGDWIPKPILRRMVRFCPHNLMTRLGEPPFDLVFLKNVLIYFDKSSKKRVLDNVCPLVRPGGLLVVGAAEGVASMISGFKRIEPWLFQRQLGKRE
ncbi:MAG: protein-glutamate O-methyltransferase CheR [Pirellulales bacterium]|nr:protein-glutamate O-methyltransferase CheR [Pirellulales bacterium]